MPLNGKFINFGLGDYKDILTRQTLLHDSRVADTIIDTWLFGEHPAVITQGVRAKDTDLIIAPSSPIPIVEVDRGGMTTLHSPGQLILYPIVKLEGGSVAAGKLSRKLQAAMQLWISEQFDVAAQTEDGHPGLYVDGMKLLSIGISVRNGVSMHGIALNLSNDLSLWNHIIACGEPDRSQTSISELTSSTFKVADQARSLANFVQKHWKYEKLDFETIDGPEK